MGKNNVKIIIGNHGSGKSDWLYNRFISMTRKEDGKLDLDKKIYLIVPEQDTNDKQRLIMNILAKKGYGAGIFNIDVMSFDRIAHSVFEILNIEPAKEHIIEDDAKTMILSLVLSKLNAEGKIKHYKRMVNKIGFAEKLTQVVSEFYSYRVSDEDIDKVIKNSKSDVLKDKLNDLKLIFKAFKETLTIKEFSIKEDKYNLLSDRILDTDIFNDAIVGFDGFTGFTPVELTIFKKISEVAKEVYVTIDLRDADTIKDFDLTKKYTDKTDVFYLSKKFVKDIADVEGINNISDLLCDNSVHDKVVKYDNGKNEKEDLSLIEKNIFKFDYELLDDDFELKNIEYYVANDIDEEIANALQIIMDLVRNKGYMYNDIKIVVPQITDYKNKIIKAFNKYEVPLFIDNSDTILNSPLVETIRAALYVVSQDFSYDSVMRYLSAGLIKKDESVNILDNYIRAHGIRGYQRYKYGFDKLDESKNSIILDSKKSFIEPLIDLYENINKKATISRLVEAIISYIESIKVFDKFDSFMDEFDSLMDSEIDYKRQYNVLKYSKEVILNVLKNIKSIESDYEEKVTIDDFRKIFDVALTGKEIKNIPYSLDQVVVGDLMRSRFDNPKVLIFMGLNQSSIPAKSNDTSLIDDRIRDEFLSIGKILSQTTEETALNQRFYIYLALTNPTDKLVLSYTKVSPAGDADKKSSVLVMLENIFTTKTDKKLLCEKEVDVNGFKYYSEDDLISFVASNIQNIISFNKKVDSDAHYDDNTLKNIIASKKILKYLRKRDDFNEICSKVFLQPNIFEDLRVNEKLNNELVDNKSYTGSVTSVESYNKCAYRYFLERTLKIRERDIYEIKPMDIGNITHKTFELLFANKNLDSKKDDELEALVDEAFIKAEKDYPIFNELSVSGKNFYGANKLEYMKERTKKLVFTASKTLMNIAKESKMKTNELEHEFNYDINENSDELGEIILNGKIDKIETYESKDNIYINVIDYKTNTKKKRLKFVDLEAGVNIQLALYLDYCLNHKFKNTNKKAIFCGAFYFWVAEPNVSISLGDSTDTIRDEVSRSLGYHGLINEDAVKEVYDKIKCEGGEMANSKKKFIFDSKNTLDGEIVTEENLNKRIESLHDTINNTITNIKKGVITARPYDRKDCDRCPYVSICKRDQLVVAKETSNDSGDE